METSSNPNHLAVKIGGLGIRITLIFDRRSVCKNSEDRSTKREEKIAGLVLKENPRAFALFNAIGLIICRLTVLRNFCRAAKVSGFVWQHKWFAACAGLYVLDEPSIGLHPRDNETYSRLCKMNCAISATRFWSSNTMKKQLCAPIMLLTWDRWRVRTAGKLSLSARRKNSKIKIRLPENMFQGKDRNPKTPQPERGKSNRSKVQPK